MFLRHQLVYLKKQAEFTFMSTVEGRLDLSHAIDDWFSRGLPCIVASQYDVKYPHIKLGILIKLNNISHRITLLVDQKYVEKTDNLPIIHTVLNALSYDVNKNNVLNFNDCEHVAVYGSFLWQYLTNYSYINQDSDIDILIFYKSLSINQLNHKIIQLNKVLARQVDGEVRFKELGDIAISELCSNSSKLLVKQTQAAMLIERKKLYAYYPSLCSR